MNRSLNLQPQRAMLQTFVKLSATINAQGGSMFIQDKAVNSRRRLARDISRYVPAILVDRTSPDSPTRHASVESKRRVRNMVIPVPDSDNRAIIKVSSAGKQVLIQLVTELRVLDITMPTLRIQVEDD